MLNSLIPTTAGIEWSGMDLLHSDFGISDVSTPRSQIPLSGMTEVPSTAVNSTQR